MLPGGMVEDFPLPICVSIVYLRFFKFFFSSASEKKTLEVPERGSGKTTTTNGQSANTALACSLRGELDIFLDIKKGDLLTS